MSSNKIQYIHGFPLDTVDTTFDESLVEANADATVRFALRSGEIKFKDGVTQKLVVSEVRTPKLKRNVVNARSQANQNDGAVVGPSGLQRNLIVPAANQGNSEAYRMPGSYRMPRSVGSPPMINLGNKLNLKINFQPFP